MRKALFVGDACVATGFARNTHHLIDALDHRCHPAGDPWEVIVLGVNHYGDPDHGFPYHVYPAISGGNYGGEERLPGMVRKHKPSVVIVQTDAWNVPGYVEAVRSVDEAVAIVGIVAIDGKNCQGTSLNGLSFAVFWTQFAEDEARLGGYVGPSAIVPLGVDLDVYKPLDKAECRAVYGNPKGALVRSDWRDCFIVGNVNRNQDRKRFDLMVDYFCDWVKEKKVDDAVLAIQSCPTGDEHVDVEQLMTYRGMRDRLISIKPPIGQGFPEKFQNLFYNALDVTFVPSQGEGWGLTVLEAMAAGKPCIVSDWAALGEWPGEAAIRVLCSTVTVNKFNVYGGVMDRELAIKALDIVYRDQQFRESMGQKALALAREDRFRWPSIGRLFAAVLEKAVYEPGMTEAAWQDLSEVAP